MKTKRAFATYHILYTQPESILRSHPVLSALELGRADGSECYSFILVVALINADKKQLMGEKKVYPAYNSKLQAIVAQKFLWQEL